MIPAPIVSRPRPTYQPETTWQSSTPMKKFVSVRVDMDLAPKNAKLSPRSALCQLLRDPTVRLARCHRDCTIRSRSHEALPPVMPAAMSQLAVLAIAGERNSINHPAKTHWRANGPAVGAGAWTNRVLAVLIRQSVGHCLAERPARRSFWPHLSGSCQG